MKLIIVLFIILVLLYLTGYKKFNAFLSMLLMSIIGGLLLGLPLSGVLQSVENGIGSILGSLALILGLGGMIAKMMEMSGAANVIADTILDRVGGRYAQFAVILSGVIIGFALFFDAGFILFIPIVIKIAHKMKVSPLWLGIPACSALLTIHTFFPPHPGMVEVIKALHVNEGLLIVVGLGVAFCSITVSGILWPRFYFRHEHWDLNHIEIDEKVEGQQVTFRSSLLFMLLPILLIAAGSFIPLFVHQGVGWIQFLGQPVVALLITLLLLLYFFGWKKGHTTDKLMAAMTVAIQSIANVLLINGAGGGLKQVFIDSGVTETITNLCSHWHLSPLVMGFAIAGTMRILLGSSTVAALTTAGMMQPLLHSSNQWEVVLVALAIGAGSMFCSHINDPGFWLFKEYFNLDIKTTLKTWTMMTIIGGLTSFGILSLLSLL